MKINIAFTFFLLYILSFPAASHETASQDFSQWLDDFKVEAKAKGISDETLTKALHNVEPLEQIVVLDRRQPEFTMTFNGYMKSVVSPARVKAASKALQANKAILDQIGKEYGVSPRIIVALWGIESNFGQVMGKLPIIPSLVTLAFDGRRSQYFRGELLDALQMLENGIPMEKMTGSWAGAIGGCQFMPSTYQKYAVQWNEHGKRNVSFPDIWNNNADIFASTANYLSQIGWMKDEVWGRAVKIPSKAAKNVKFGHDESRTIGELRKTGVTLTNGKKIPGKASERVFLIKPDGGPAFIVYNNFDILMQWNRSTLFATAVGLLADRISGH